MTESTNSDLLALARNNLPFGNLGSMEIIATQLFSKQMNLQRMRVLFCQFAIFIVLKYFFETVPDWLKNNISWKTLNFQTLYIIRKESNFFIDNDTCGNLDSFFEKIKKGFTKLDGCSCFLKKLKDEIKIYTLGRENKKLIKEWILNNFEKYEEKKQTEYKLITSISSSSFEYNTLAKFRNVHETEVYLSFKKLINRHLHNSKILDKNNCLAINFNGPPGTGKSTFINYIGKQDLVSCIFKLSMINFPQFSLEQIITNLNKNSKIYEKVIIIIDEPDKHLNQHIKYKLTEYQNEREKKFKKEHEFSEEENEKIIKNIKEENLRFYHRLIDGDVLNKYEQVILIFLTNNWDQLFQDVHQDYDAVKNRIINVNFAPLKKIEILDFIDKTFQKIEEKYDKQLFLKRVPEKLELTCRELDSLMTMSHYKPEKLLEMMCDKKNSFFKRISKIDAKDGKSECDFSECPEYCGTVCKKNIFFKSVFKMNAKKETHEKEYNEEYEEYEENETHEKECEEEHQVEYDENEIFENNEGIYCEDCEDYDCGICQECHHCMGTECKKNHCQECEKEKCEKCKKCHKCSGVECSILITEGIEKDSEKESTKSDSFSSFLKDFSSDVTSIKNEEFQQLIKKKFPDFNFNKKPENYKEFKDEFVDKIKNYLDDISTATTKEKKIKIMHEMYIYMLKNKRYLFILLIEFPAYLSTNINKVIELKQNPAIQNPEYSHVMKTLNSTEEYLESVLNLTSSYYTLNS